MPRDPDDLKSMPLYRDVDRIYSQLAAAGFDDMLELSASDVAAYDQYHYHGTDAVDVAIKSLDISSEDHVLEIGSGIGGPSRRIADRTGAKVVALELQPDLNETARDLTARCGLTEQVEHVCADVLDYSPGGMQFDAIVSWLAFFHIEQRQQLLERCASWLKLTGKLFVEDLFARGIFTTEEQADLDVILFSRYLPPRDVYEADFRDAGFSSVEIEDMTAVWQRFTAERFNAFRSDREQQEMIHGGDTVAGLDTFYGTVARLFADGNLGGIRLTASTT